MKNRAFYRLQIAPNILYFLGLGFFGLMVIACVVAKIWFLYEEWGNPEYIWFAPMMLGFTGFFLGFYIYIKRVQGKRRRKTYQKYEELSEAEQEEVNTELCVKFPSILWGENRLYIHSSLFLEFIDYDDMVWLYPCNTMIPMSVSYEGVSVDGNITAFSLHVYDTEGTRYKIPTTGPYNTQCIVEDILQVAPGILYGYSKEWGRLAKKDFNEFLYEARKKYVNTP